MAFKLVYPLPEGELWGCLPCEMNAGRDVDADVLLIEGEPGQRGVVKVGLCATHAEMLPLCGMDEIREAQRKYQELEKE
jgi:hypothetical protein